MKALMILRKAIDIADLISNFLNREEIRMKF